MPFEMEDPDGEESPTRRERFSAPRGAWWRPAGTWGRVLLGVSAFVVLAGVAIAYQTARTFLERDARYRVAGTGNIQAAGLAEVSRAEILPVFGEDIGRNIFFVPLGERRKQLEQIPWVQHATVMRLLPDQIRVEVVERQPVAFVRHGQQIGLVDANGVLLSMPVAMMAQHHYSFPVLTGIDPGDPQPSRKARIELYQRLMSELDANGQHFSNQISEIDLTDPEDARVLMQEQGTDMLAHFGEDHFLERYQRYKAHIAEWRQQYPKLAGVDLRYDQQVVLQMAPGAATDEAAVKSGDLPSTAAKPAAAKPPAAQPTKPAPAETAKADAPKHTAAAKPASAKPASTANAHTGRTSVAKAKQAREAREKAAARKRAEAKRAALKKTQQKTAPKPQTPAPAGQGQ
jgi:cell division protein FtsQ